VHRHLLRGAAVKRILVEVMSFTIGAVVGYLLVRQ